MILKKWSILHSLLKNYLRRSKRLVFQLPIEEQKKSRKWNVPALRTVIDEERNYELPMFDFNTIAELQDVMSTITIHEIIITNGSKNSGVRMAPDALEDKSSTHFFYDGNTFKNSFKIRKKKKSYEGEEISAESAALSEEQTKKNLSKCL
jgi:ribosomal protein S6E (S10)